MIPNRRSDRFEQATAPSAARAVRQFEDHRARTPGLWFAEHEGSALTLDEAYAVQDQVVGSPVR